MTDWRYTVDIANLIGREDEPTLAGHKSTCRDVAEALKNGLEAFDSEAVLDLIERLIELGDETDDYYSIEDIQGEFNFTMHDLYDYADARKIWLGLPVA